MSEILVKIAAVLALLAALFFAEQYIEGRGYDRARAEDAEAVAIQKAQASAMLAEEVAKTRRAEQVLEAAKNSQELKDAEHEKTVADLAERLRRVAGPSGRLRDPYAVGCGDGGSNTAPAASSASGVGSANGTQTGGLLSEQLTKFLFEQAASADTINDAYASCRADSFAVRDGNSH